MTEISREMYHARPSGRPNTQRRGAESQRPVRNWAFRVQQLRRCNRFRRNRKISYARASPMKEILR